MAAAEKRTEAAGSSIHLDNIRNTDLNARRCGMVEAPAVGRKEEQLPVAEVDSGGKNKNRTETVMMAIYRKKEEAGRHNKMVVVAAGCFGNRVEPVHGEQVSDGSYR